MNVSPFGSAGVINRDKHAPVFPLPALATLPDYLSHRERTKREKRNIWKEGLGLTAVLSEQCSVQFSSVTQSCPTLCDPMNRSMLGLPVHHQLPEFIQTHVH